MNKLELIKELIIKYPHKSITCLPEEEPTEIICEIEPATDHPEYSRAIAIIDQSEPHYHHKLTETYTVLKGNLEVYKDGIKYVLNQGETIKVLPGVVHWAKGNATWIECNSSPGWIIEDHILA